MQFSVKTSEVETSKTTSSHLNVDVFCIDNEEEKRIGSYKRNYHTMYNTFFPFKQGEQWYALYSPNYDETRIMKLPSCEDIAGSPMKFCPVEYFVPMYADMYSPTSDDEWNKQYEAVEGQMGFISGCYFGDNNLWKIGYIDLSELKERTFKIDFRFGDILQPAHMSLKECIDLSNYAPDLKDFTIHIAHASSFDLSIQHVANPSSLELENEDE